MANAGVNGRVNEIEVQELLEYAKSIADKYIKLADTEINEFNKTINDPNASEGLRSIKKPEKKRFTIINL